MEGVLELLIARLIELVISSLCVCEAYQADVLTF
jgi:hypothetical protein